MRGTGHEAAAKGTRTSCASLARMRRVSAPQAKRASLVFREQRSRRVASPLPGPLFLAKRGEQLVGHVAFLSRRDHDHRPPETVITGLGWSSHSQL